MHGGESIKRLFQKFQRETKRGQRMSNNAVHSGSSSGSPHSNQCTFSLSPGPTLSSARFHLTKCKAIPVVVSVIKTRSRFCDGKMFANFLFLRSVLLFRFLLRSGRRAPDAPKHFCASILRRPTDKTLQASDFIAFL